MRSRPCPLRPQANRPRPPFPTWQMLVLALCRICEPIAFMSIFPYIYGMVENFHLTDDPSMVPFYGGMITSAFTFAEFSTGVLWGRLSDKIGRKPVLLTGLAGTALSVLVFGFAPNLWVAIIARALGGLLNGNIGVLQTTVAELVTVKEHQPRAYTIMPLVWCLGSIAGPVIGGALAVPCESYPNLFPRGTIWDKYPYLLPNLFSAATCCCGVVIGILFLEETHAEKRNRHDPGLALGDCIQRKFAWKRENEKQDDLSETASLLSQDEHLPTYRSNDSSPRLSSVAAPDLEAQPLLDPKAIQTRYQAARGAETDDRPKTSSQLEKSPQSYSGPAFTKPVVMNIVSYGILAFHTMTFDQLFPMFLETPPVEPKKPVSLPFKFVDGFGLSQKEVGVIMGVQGVFQLFATVFLFPFVVRRIGTLHLFRLLAITYFMLYFLTPYLVLMPEDIQYIGIYVAILWRCVFSSMAYPSNAILLTNSAPSLQTLGTINGVAASTASLCRAFGPTISGFLYGAGLSAGFSGLAWWCNGLVTIGGAFISMQVTEPKGRMDEMADEEEDSGEGVDNADDDEETTIIMRTSLESVPARRPSLDI